MALTDLLPARFRRDTTIIPVVRMTGPIMATGNAFRPALSLAAIAGPLKRAFSFRRAPAVAIIVNSPGGSPVQSRLIHRRIRELAEQHEKHVLVFVEDVAASGGYMIAMAGDEIFADETSIVGSIGVVAAGFGFPEALAKLGVERRVYTAGTNKVILDPFQPEKKGDIAHVKTLQEDIHEVFIDMVKQARGAKLADNKDLFSGLFWTGRKARELGLVDECGLMGPVLRQRYGKKVRPMLVSAKRGLFGRAQPGVDTASHGQALGGAMGANLAHGAIEAVEERALWSRFGL